MRSVSSAKALDVLGTAELRSGRPEPAVVALERAVAIRAGGAGTAPGDLAAIRFTLAKAIVAAHGPAARARKLAEEARDALAHSGDARGAGEVSTWLQAQH